MPLPKFLDGTKFNGETHFWAVINGEVRRGEIEHPTTTPYLAFFGWVASSDRHRASWSQRDVPITPCNRWVDRCYRTKREALVAQRKLRCPCKCGRGRLRFAEHYGKATAVGVYCSKCWAELLKQKRGVGMAGLRVR